MVFRVLFLIFLVKTSSAKTCEERLDHIENLLDSLKLRMGDKKDAEDKVGSGIEIFFEMQLGKEKQKMERRIAHLEKMLHDSDIQMDKMKARVSEVESTNRELIAKITAMEFNNCDVSEKKNHINTIFEKNIKTSTKPTLSKDNKVQVPFESSRTRGEVFVKAQRNFSRTEINIQPSFQKTNPSINKKQDLSIEKRLLTGVHTTKPPFADGVAFSAYVSTQETDISKDHTIKFDRIVTNVDNHYNPHSGIFTAPQHGVYVFTWNLYCYVGGYIYSQILVNSNAVGAMFTSGEGATAVRTTTGVVVVEVNQGDVVFVRTHPTESHLGNLYSLSIWRSSFNGWKIY